RAVANAAKSAGQELAIEDLAVMDNGLTNQSDPEKHQRFESNRLRGRAEVKLIWLPMSRDRLRLCWDVVLTTRSKGEMFRILVDTQTGAVLVRHCLTEHISDASYRVFTSDSPSPMSPGLSAPGSTQPSYVPSTLVTLAAFDTNASPNGWIDDGVTET